MSAGNDKNNHVMPNESEEDKLPDSLDPKARPDAEAAREELFKQNILMDVDERPKGIEAQEQIEAQRDVEQADENSQDGDSIKDESDLMAAAEAAATENDRDDGERIGSESVAGLAGSAADTAPQPKNSGEEPRQQEELAQTSSGQSAFLNLSVDQQIEDTLAQQAPETTDPETTDSGSNQDPVAADSNVSTNEDNLFSGQLIASDPDAGDILTFSLTSSPAQGSVVVQADGAYDFNPGSDFNDLAVGEYREVTFNYQVEDSSGASDSAEITIRVTGTNDGPSAVADLGATDEGISTSINVLANDSDPDASDSLSIINASIVSGSGSLGVVGDSLLYVPHSSYNSLADGEQVNIVIEYTIQDPHGAVSTATATVTVSGVNDGIQLTQDSDASANIISEAVSDGDYVGVTALAIDPDTSDSVTYSLSNDAGGRFAVDPVSGEITVADASLIDFETAISHVVTVVATSSDGSSSTENFTINVSDVNEFGASPVIDTDAAANTANESAGSGTSVGIIAFSTDPDAGDSVTYSLSVNPNNAFAIDASTGEVTVADPSGLDFESAQTMQIEVTATSTDGSSSSGLFAINITNDNEDPVITKIVVSNTTTTLNQYDVVVNPDGSTGTMGSNVNVSVFQPGGSASQIVISNDGIGIDSTNVSGDIANQIDYDPASGESEQLVLSFINPVTNLQLTTGKQYDNEGGVGEQGIWTAYDSHGNIVGSGELDANLGTNVGPNSYQYDIDTSLPISKIIIEANDYSDSDFSIVDIQFNETFEVPLNDNETIDTTISEGVTNGTSVADVNAFDVDGDTLTYSITQGNADGAFAIDSSTGVISIADSSGIDYETATIRVLTVVVDDGNGGTDSAEIEISITDENEFSISAISDSDASSNIVSESAATGANIGITAFAQDLDGSDSVTYSLDDDFGGAFTIDANSGVITVSDSSLLDYETNPTPSVTVRATSSDGSFSTTDMSINLSDANEAPTDLSISGSSDTFEYLVEHSNPVAFWRLGESAGNTVAVDEMGNHDGTYLQGANTTNGTGPFSGLSNTAANFDGQNDYIEIPNSSEFDLSEGTIHAWFKVDAFDGTDHTILSMDSSGTDTGSMYLAVDSNRQDLEFYIEDTAGPSTGYGNNSHVINSASGSITTGVWHQVSVSFGSDGISMYLDGNLVASDSYTGGIGNADDEPITIGASQRNVATEGQAVSGELDRFFDGQIAEVAIFDNALSQSEINALIDSGLNAVELDGSNIIEHALPGTVVGTVTATDPDAGDTFTYSLTDDAGGRFEIDPSTGEVKVSTGDQLDYESQASHSVTVEVTDSGGEAYSESFTIDLIDVNEILGSGSAESISGSQLADVIQGLAGNDHISGDQGDDFLYGGAGNDQIAGGLGDDALEGGLGDDVLFGGDGNDIFIFEQGEGSDIIDGGAGSSWTDTISIEYDIAGATDPASPWQIEVNGQAVDYDIDAGLLELGADVSGVIQFDDGTQLTFDNIENIEW